MTDIASITAGMQAIKLALGIAKDIRDSTQAFSEAEMRYKMSEIYTSLSEARMTLADAQDEIHTLNKTIVELEAKFKASDELEYRDGCYFRKEEVEGKPNGPFCPACWDGPEKRMSTMSKLSGHFSFAGRYKCNACQVLIK